MSEFKKTDFQFITSQAKAMKFSLSLYYIVSDFMQPCDKKLDLKFLNLPKNYLYFIWYIWRCFWNFCLKKVKFSPRVWFVGIWKSKKHDDLKECVVLRLQMSFYFLKILSVLQLKLIILIMGPFFKTCLKYLVRAEIIIQLILKFQIIFVEDRLLKK